MEDKKIAKEFTLRSMIWGVVVGIFMMALLAYMYAVLGLDMNVSPVSIVLGILLVPLIGGKTNVREVTQMQTTASAVSSVMTTYATCFVASLWISDQYNLFITVAVMLLSSAVGIIMVAFIRKQFIADKSMAFPQSVLCVTALDNVGNMKGKSARVLYIFVIVGIAIVVGQNILGIIPVMFDMTQYLPEGMTMGFMFMPLMLGLGYVLGPKACLFLFIGSVVSNLILAPIGTSVGWYPSPGVNYTAMQNFNIPIFVGVALAAMFIPLIRQWRTLKNALRFDVGATKESSREFSLKGFIIGGALCMLGLLLIFWLYYQINPFLVLLLLIITLFFSLICVRVASEIGLGANIPLSIVLIAIAYLLTKNVLGSLMIAVVMFSIATLAGNTMMDLKTGHDVGASPKKQIWAQFVGIVPGVILGLVFLFMFIGVYGMESDYATFPIGKLFYSITAGMSGEAGELFDVGRLLIGGAAGTVLTLTGLPAIILGFSLYMPPATATGIAIGGLIRWILVKRLGQERAKIYDNAAVGVILGDTLVTIGLTVASFFSA